MSKKNKNKTFVFIQHVPPYRHDILVCVGVTPAKAISFINRNVRKEDKKAFKDYITEHKDLFLKIVDKKMNGYAVRHLEKDYLMLIIPKMQDEWWYWESLIHELSHTMDSLVEMKMLEHETEARAYLHEYLFREMRIEIQRKSK